MATFETAIETVLKHEGGYVNDPKDPGGETNYGISKRSYPDVDIANLTEDGASEIYRNDWWEKNEYWIIDDQAVATKVFDLSVNMGAHRAHKLLQQSLRSVGHILKEDGILGPVSFAMINASDPVPLLAAYRSEAAGFYRMLNKPRFQNGWLNRAYS